MKAEHRKQLETNTLADTLGKVLKGINHGLSRNFYVVLGVIVVVFGLFFAWREFSARSQRANASLWVQWDQLDDPEVVDTAVKDLTKDQLDHLTESREQLELDRLLAFAKQNPGTMQSRVVRFQVARLAMFEGLRDLGRPGYRKEARTKLELARETYEKLIKDARDFPILHQEALLNTAKANESLGNIEAAKKYYEQLQAAYPKSEIRTLAMNNLERLKQDAPIVDELAEELTEIAPGAAKTA